MAYKGTTAPIPIGQVGLYTDEPQDKIPANAAAIANNISLFTGQVEKSSGSIKYTTTQLEAPIIALADWWPIPTNQRLIAATSNGKLWRDSGDGSWSSLTALPSVEIQTITFNTVPDAGAFSVAFNAVNSSSINFNDPIATVQTKIRTIPALANAIVTGTFTAGFRVQMNGTLGDQTMLSTNANTLTTMAVAVVITYAEFAKGKTTLGATTTDSMFVAGGAETSNRNRKLFYFPGTSQPQVISGDSTITTDIANPAADWTTTLPQGGIVYQGRLIAWAKHRIYISKIDDHEDFTTTAVDGTGAASFSIFSGEGDAIIAAAVYKGALILAKAPFGLYVFQWNGGEISDPNNVSISKLSDAFGISSPHGFTQVLDDLWGGANTGSIFSMAATNNFGSFEAGDILSIGRIRNYVREQFSLTGVVKQQALYYPEKEIAYFTYRAQSNTQDRMLVIDVSKQTPRYTIETKDQPTCMTLRRDSNKIQRPIYGADTGYVYLMDQGPRNVDNAPYVGEYRTPEIDFSYLDQTLASRSKIFDWVQITYLAQGTWNFYLDVYCDGIFVETITFTQQQTAAVLDSFILDTDALGITYTEQLRKPLHCTGRTISFRVWNNGINESFKIQRMTVGLRASGDQSRSSKG